MKRIVFLVAVIAMLFPASSCRKDDTPLLGAGDEYVDLGLPSGILWKATSEDLGSRGITYNEAFNFFDPDFDQWIDRKDAEELIEYCTFTVRNTVRVTGPNGNRIEMVKDMIWTVDVGGPDVQPYCLIPQTPTISYVSEYSRHYIHLIKRPASQ